MNQIFHPSMNTIARVSIFGAIFVLIGIGLVIYYFVQSSYVTQVDVARLQPVPFSHQHHVNQLGIDCRYCHTSVEDSSFAGLPPTKTCMTCHSQVWTESPMLAPVRESFRTGEPIAWTRVHDLSDFVYFNHSIHLEKGVACETCHGRVDLMPLAWKDKTLFMSWCLECHRNPEEFVRPVDEVFTMGWAGPGVEEPVIDSRQLVAEYNINISQLDDCSICHR
jgi:ferredoxin